MQYRNISAAALAVQAMALSLSRSLETFERLHLMPMSALPRRLGRGQQKTDYLRRNGLDWPRDNGRREIARRRHQIEMGRLQVTG